MVGIKWVTKNLTGVGLVVDGQPNTDVASMPSTTEGDFEQRGGVVVELPCDGNVHTIMLIGTGTAGSAFATKAVATIPT
jgi:hypothetical protein